MTRGTTPTLIFNFCDSGVDISSAQKIEVAFAQCGAVLFVRENGEVDTNRLILTLTQEETLMMKAKEFLQYQVRFLINGKAFCTPIYKSMVSDVLEDTVIEV